MNCCDKIIKIKGLDINYKSGGKGTPLLFLHGWRSDSDRYVDFINFFKDKGYSIYVPDLPGFGSTPEPKDSWDLDDYVDFIIEFIEKLKIKDFVLLGHSFGGRMSIKLAARKYPGIKRVILCSAAGIWHKKNGKQKLMITVAKICKFFFSLPIIHLLKPITEKLAFMVFGYKDYFQASGVMRETLKKVIEEDLFPLLKEIEVPALVVWGEKDMTTPVVDAYTMKAAIKDSELKIIERADHGFPYKRAGTFNKLIYDYLKNES